MFGTEPKNASSHNISKIQLKILCVFCSNTNLSILHFYYSSKNYSSKVYTSFEKVVVPVTLSTEKLSLLFLDFSKIFNQFFKLLDQTTKQGTIFMHRRP
jgi:hypothetical protein